jgi:hypothetical protein
MDFTMFHNYFVKIFPFIQSSYCPSYSIVNWACIYKFFFIVLQYMCLYCIVNCAKDVWIDNEYQWTLTSSLLFKVNEFHYIKNVVGEWEDVEEVMES